MASKALRFFISSTYLDLKEYREEVIQTILRLGKDRPVSMEYFLTAEKEPTVLSLDELDESDAYIGIIGHRYGTVPEGERKSITHLEYERALELHRSRQMPLFLFLTSGRVQLAGDLIEDDGTRRKHHEFREALKRDHTPREVDSPKDLAIQLAAALTKDVEAIERTKKLKTKVFHEDQAARVFDEADVASQQAEKTIDQLLKFMASSFREVFRLDSASLTVHPFFSKVTERLTPLIPGVRVDSETGILKRADLRHVILRTETLHTFLRHLTPDQLRECGMEIGQAAALDLVESTLKDSYVPASPRAFVDLWGYWDGTGGWGKLELLESPGPDPVSLDDNDSDSWTIKVENNFLTVEGDLKRTHEFCEFWCGYIEGVLETALPRIEELMRDLDEEEGRKVSLPAYHRVREIKHLRTDDEPHLDLFQVHFEKLELSTSLLHLGNARRQLNDGSYEQSALYSSAAVSKAGNPEVLRRTAEKLGFEADFLALVEKLIGTDVPNNMPREEAKSWYEVAKRLVDELAKGG